MGQVISTEKCLFVNSIMAEVDAVAVSTPVEDSNSHTVGPAPVQFRDVPAMHNQSWPRASGLSCENNGTPSNRDFAADENNGTALNRNSADADENNGTAPNRDFADANENNDMADVRVPVDDDENNDMADVRVPVDDDENNDMADVRVPVDDDENNDMADVRVPADDDVAYGNINHQWRNLTLFIVGGGIIIAVSLRVPDVAVNVAKRLLTIAIAVLTRRIAQYFRHGIALVRGTLILRRLPPIHIPGVRTVNPHIFRRVPVFLYR